MMSIIFKVLLKLQIVCTFPIKKDMPTSKKRQHHHAHTAHHPHPESHAAKKHTKLLAASIVFFALIGLGIAFFATGNDIIWLLVGAAAGAAIGYLVGGQAEKALLKK
jgi:hypothetical protein